jgi:hypothetical protein
MILVQLRGVRKNKMAYFAQLDENNIVTQVISINNTVLDEPRLTFPETEILGQLYIKDVLKLDKNWKQTSYNNSFRKQYAGIGFLYDAEHDVFIVPKPVPSWFLDENSDWQAPIPKPTEGFWSWNEDTFSWEEIELTDEQLDLLWQEGNG